MAKGFRFTLGGIDHKLSRFDNKVERAAFAVTGFYAPKTEAWMKHNAPWTDRTTNARNGLFAAPFQRGDTVGIVLAHSVDYGIYLELGTENMAARPVIVPAMKLWGPRVMKKFIRLIDRMGK